MKTVARGRGYGTTRGSWVWFVFIVAALLASSPVHAGVLVLTPAGTEALPEELAAKARAAKGVTRVERYLLIKAQPHDVIGVEPDAPLRIIGPDGQVVEAKVESGKAFRKEDDGKNVAILGKVYAEDYAYRSGTGQMATMKHLLEVGQTFKLTGEAGPRVRVLGMVSVQPESAAAKVFLPLATAQKLLDRPGKVSHLFVVVEGDPDAAVKALESAVGPQVQVRVVAR